MATAFSQNKRELIRENLKEVAKECLLKYGVKKTTVDEIVKIVGISKGSFYNFYNQKEILFFQVLEDYQISIIYELENKIEKEENIGIDKFTNLIYGLFQNVRESFLMNIIQNQELEYLMRKLPKELIKDHHSLDNILIKKVLSRIKVKESINSDVIAASLRAIFMNMIYMEEIGEENFDEMLRLLIKGIAIQVIEEDYSND